MRMNIIVLRAVVPLLTDVSEELTASIIRTISA
jgi:hypothetical protein